MTVFVPSRRGLITGIASLIASPAIVRAESLMVVKKFPEWPARGWYLSETGITGFPQGLAGLLVNPPMIFEGTINRLPFPGWRPLTRDEIIKRYA